MKAKRCPKCVSHEQMYSAPLGKVVRNPYAAIATAVYDNCPACNGTGYVPSAVIDSIVNYARTDNDAQEIVDQLSWGGDHYYFKRHGMYVGVELDGYMHT